MSRRRRTFGIDMPEADPAPEAVPDAPAPRRSPMAAAIGENADALAARAEAERAIRAENDALAHEFVALRAQGLVLRLVPLADVLSERLERDRLPGPDPDLDELCASIRETGLSNPIRVEERADGRFELVQGLRRLSAFRRLAETDAAFAAIPAAILPRGEDLGLLYRQMVDENVVRRDLSFAEMAGVAMRYAADPRTGTDDVDAAVREIFASAGYQKRSYIRSFARMLAALGGGLRHPAALPRALGLRLAKEVEEGGADRLLAALAALPPDADAEAEQAALRAALEGGEAGPKGQGAEAPTRTGAPRAPRTTFEVAAPGGRVRCTAGVGRLELRLDRDLTGIDRERLERGVRRLIETLDGG